jgi:uncharacterized membrane protein
VDAPGASPRSPGAIGTILTGINAKGQSVGAYEDAFGIKHGFIYDGGLFSILDAPGATSTYPTSINASGQVAGYYVTFLAVPHGFVYSGGSFTTLDVPGANSTHVTSINANGEVAGYYDDPHGATHGFVALITSIDCLFNWAESNYPNLFAPANATTENWNTALYQYNYRYYSATNAYLGISSLDNHVYYIGPDGILRDEGLVSYWLSKAGCK